MSAKHKPCDCDVIHDDGDTTAVHATTEAEARVARILGWGPRRFTARQWQQVQELAAGDEEETA